MAYNFADLQDVLNNVQIYISITNGGIRTLAWFPSIAQNRWSWIVDNWDIFYNRFLINANGNEEDMLALKDLAREVESYKIGNKINPLENSAKYKRFRVFLNQIALTEISPDPKEKIYIDDELLRVSKLQEADFRKALEIINTEALSLEQEIGLSDQTVLDIYGMTAISKKRSPSIRDLDTIDTLKQVARLIKGLIYNLQLKQKRPPNLLNISNQNIAPGSNISIDASFLTSYPTPFEISLEHMAKKYLGSNRYWYELATVNNLQPPFIDEVGEKFSLLAPAAANNLVISDSSLEMIAPGTFVNIGSYKFKEESRAIERVIHNKTSETVILFLSGDQNLNTLLPSEGAFVRIYKPHTTRKGKFVLIPSKLPPSAEDKSKPTPMKSYLARLEKYFINFGIDVARDETTGDWLFDETGNFQLAAGIKAIRQAVMNALKTEPKELPFHPTYGIQYNIGDNFFGNASEAVVQGEMIINAIMKDLRFEKALIHNLAVTETGVSLQIAVKIKGLDSPIPLSFVS